MTRGFIYLVYFLAAMAVFGVVRFPERIAAQKIETAAESMFPGLDITMDRVSLTFPPGLTAKDPIIRVGDRVTLVPGDLRIHLPAGTLLGLKKELDFFATLMEGEVSGQIRLSSFFTPACSGLDLAFAGVRVTNLAVPIPGMTVQAAFELSGEYRGTDEETDPAGTGNLRLENLACTIQDPFLNTMGITALEFDQTVLTFHRNGWTIPIENLAAGGDILHLTAAGQVAVTGGSPGVLENWHVDLQGSLHPRPAYVSRFSGILTMENLFKSQPEKGIPFTLTGPATALELQL